MDEIQLFYDLVTINIFFLKLGVYDHWASTMSVEVCLKICG